MPIVPETRLRWFTFGVTVFLILACNALLLGALWASGLDLEFVLSQSDVYDSSKGYCVRVAWAQISGAEGPVRVCSEWLDTTDPTGKLHVLRADEPLAMNEDGRLYYERLRQTDFRLLVLVVFSMVVIVLGVRTKQILIRWYRTRLQQSEP